MSRIMLRLCPGLVYAIASAAGEEMEEAEFMAMFICVRCSRCIIKHESHVLFFHVRRKNIIKAACLLAFVGKNKTEIFTKSLPA